MLVREKVRQTCLRVLDCSLVPALLKSPVSPRASLGLVSTGNTPKQHLGAQARGLGETWTLV